MLLDGARVVPEAQPFQGVPLLAVPVVTEKDFLSLTAKMKSTTCHLDPIPSSLVKNINSNICPAIVKIINKSLQLGVVPMALEQAVISSLLKMPNLDPSQPNNYRPVSHLPFLSKILERVVAL